MNKTTYYIRNNKEENPTYRIIIDTKSNKDVIPQKFRKKKYK